MVASLVGMAQQLGIGSGVGEPVEPTNCGRKKCIQKQKKLAFSQKTP